MSSSISAWSLDPKYGKVYDLCKELGYGSTIRGASRFYHTLRDKTARYRKKFIGNSTDSHAFSLDYNDSQVQRCASSFLDSKHHLFEATQEAESFGWPTYPEDKDRILIGLAKLMCTQECYSMKNNTSPEGGTMIRESWDMSLSPSPPPNEYPKVIFFDTDQDSEADDLGRTEKNTKLQLHLDFIYPLVETKDGTSRDWLFKSGPNVVCPEDVKPYIFRYFHDHQLYHKTSSGPLELFLTDLKHHLRIECGRAKDMQIYEKCKNLVSYHSGRFKKYGFLEGSSSALKRTREFEKAWKARRSDWLAFQRAEHIRRDGDHPSGSNLQENTPLSQSPSESSNVGERRARDVSPDNSSNGAKRQKIDIDLPPVDSPVHFDLDGDISFLEHGRSNEDVVFEPHQPMPVAPMLSSSTEDLHAASPKQPGTFLVLQESSPAPDAGSQHHTIVRNGTPVSEARSITMAPLEIADSVGEDNAGHSLLLHRQSAPYAIPGQSLYDPGKSSSRLTSDLPTPLVTTQSFIRPLASALPSAPAPANFRDKLQFILEKRKGVYDHANPVFRKDIWKLKLSDIFDLVSSRSGQPLTSFSSLALRFQWGGRDVVAVEKSLGDQEWKDIKERIKNEFLTAKEKKPECTKFQIWVEACGEVTATDDDDEDW